jgi:outer membrane protein assembly factor BamB
MQIGSRRSRGRWVWPLSVVLVYACSCVALATPAAAARVAATSGGDPWPTYHGNLSRTGYSTDTTISPQNAAQLHQTFQLSAKAPISAQPIVGGGVVYWGDWNGIMHATTVSGKSLWSTSLGITPRPPGCIYNLATQGILSTPTMGKIGKRRVLWAGGGRGQMVALNASNGRIIWQTSLRMGQGTSIWSSPAYYKGSIFVGVASFQGCPPEFGSVVRLNAATGAVQATLNFSTKVPARCRELGAWSSPAVDTSENAIFIGTSNDFCNSKYQDAIIKLNPSTLRITSLWQVPASQHPADSDFGATPMFFSANIGGVNRQLVGAVNKNGVYYALDRDDLAAGPVWSYVAAKATSIAAQACGNEDAISSSSWAGPGSPIMVAGLSASGSNCIGTLAALNPSTGQPEWQISLPGSVEGALTEVPGIVAVGTGPTVDLVSSANGQVLFSYTEPTKPTPKGVIYGAPTGEFWAPPTLDGNSLFVANEDGSFRAFSP